MSSNPSEYTLKGRKKGKPLGPDAKHIPNKAESKELRKLMKKTGKSEEEIRSDPELRKQLSNASKEPNKTNMDRNRLLLNRRKRKIAQLMGLPIYSPIVEQEAKNPNNISLYDL